MAYMNQEKKAKIAPVIKAICQKYGIKGSLSIRNHSTLCLTIKSGVIDFIGNSNEVCSKDSYQMGRGFTPTTRSYEQVNVYHFKSHYDGIAKECLAELIDAMNEGNWDHSDIQSDYFNVGWYTDVNIGNWNKLYELTA